MRAAIRVRDGVLRSTLDLRTARAKRYRSHTEGKGAVRAMALGAALEELCRLCVQRLPVDWAVIHLMTGGDVVGVAAASDELAAALGEIPFLMGEGPCVDAYQLR